MLQRVSTAALILALCLGARAQTGPDVDMRNAIDAIKAGNVEELKSLLERSPGLVKKADRQYGATLLHWAAAQKDLQAVILLTENENKASLAAKNKDGATPLQVAIVPTPGKPGGPDLLKLVEKLSTPEVVRIPNLDGKTALHLAFQYNEIEVARFLINVMKADVNARTKTRRKPLDYAPVAKKSEIAKLLEADKVGLNPPPRPTPSPTASPTPPPTPSPTAPPTPSPMPSPTPATADSAVTLRAAARDGNLVEVRRILRTHREWIDRVNEHKETALHLAAKNCQLEVVIELIRTGADPKLEDDKGRRYCDLLCLPLVK